ncbi:hypothetical protein TD95_001843 [Thielaviopsis punctulata]|uniref:DUF788 domain protein n=1 Tax=Thielaviopsis punctulata TaxID=72032 RepID=A0A0F4ZDV6_9PEZI|nr:hypothetical protein TD95_001843 [Thielaviopsis punctulata]
MAQKAKKELAKANSASLKTLHTLSAVFNSLFLVFSLFLRPRSLFYYTIFSIPAFVCQLVIEKSGRPSYDPTTRALRSAGEDLAAPGLTDYMFDTIWVTWACLILVMLFGNGAWAVWALVPAFGLYKAKGLLSAGRQLAGLGGMPGMGGAGAGAGVPEAAPQNRKQRRQA